MFVSSNCQNTVGYNFVKKYHKNFEKEYFTNTQSRTFLAENKQFAMIFDPLCQKIDLSFWVDKR